MNSVSEDAAAVPGRLSLAPFSCPVFSFVSFSRLYLPGVPSYTAVRIGSVLRLGGLGRLCVLVIRDRLFPVCK